MRRRDFITLLGGAALAGPIAARAQQPERMRRIGFLSLIAENDPESQSWIKELTHHLQELGWTNGRNVLIDYRFGNADAKRLQKLAQELIESRPDVIVAAGAPPSWALRQQTLSIPLVFLHVADPVAAGFVTNLAQPEGNITGFTNFEFSMGGKWIQFLRDLAPAVGILAVVFDPDNPTWGAYLRTIEAAAPTFGVKLTPVGVHDAAEIEQRIAAFGHEPNSALIVLPSPVAIQHREAIIAVAARQRLPAIYPYRFFTVGGGLISYGPDLVGLYGRAASYVDRILKGAKVAELPVQQPTKFELVINLKTAKALGITIAPSLLAAADEVIE
jgi:putative ABC transport system substrate-binding protein